MDQDPLELNRRNSLALLHKFEYLRKLRPGVLASFLTRLQAPDDRRHIVALRNGLKLYLDPFTHLGRSVLKDGEYEPETEQLIREHLRPGHTFLDVGANEGYFSALAGTLVGSKGLVIAIEPQFRLRDIIDINMRLNNLGHYTIYSTALGGEDGTSGTLNLWPTFNVGAASIVRHYRFSHQTQAFTFTSLARILRESQIERIDLAKVDVEGFEAEVVHSERERLREKRIRRLLLDYHASILAERGINPGDIHAELLSCGYRLVVGQPPFDSYSLYEAT